LSYTPVKGAHIVFISAERASAKMHFLSDLSQDARSRAFGA